MAGTRRKISDLPAASTLDPAADLLMIVDVSEPSAGDRNKRLTINQLLATAPDSSTAARGFVELATDAETQAGVEPQRAVTPAGLQSKLSDSTSTTSSTTIASATAVKAAKDVADAALARSGGTVTGVLEIGAAGALVFEGSGADEFETTLGVVNPTEDRSILLPNVSGTVITSGDSGTVTSAMIANGTIVDGDISATAEIAVSKLADGAPRQVLQTDADGTGVEWSNSLDLPGSLDVSLAATFDATVEVAGKLTLGSTIVFEGTSADDFETTLSAGDPTADRAITLPNQSGTVLVSGNASIVDADISASAEIAVSKLADGAARQVLQTSSDGLAVEWSDNIDLPGTLDVTGTATFDGAVVCNSTGYLDLPVGTTAQRPGSPNSGMIRFNSELTRFEGYNGSAWGTIGGGATGGAGDRVFMENDQTVTTDYSITSGRNAVTAGPVTVNAGVTVTIPSGSAWVIV